MTYRQDIPVAITCLTEYPADMENRGTIADITKWAETALPGEEPRARSVIVGCRKAGLFTKGGHGRNAPFMMLSDFPTAILAVLHPGQVTQVDEAVKRYWGLVLAGIEVDDPDRIGPTHFEPYETVTNEFLKPYLARFNLDLFERSNLIGALTALFASYAPHHDFILSDCVVLESLGDQVAVKIVLNGGYRNTIDGWRGAGPDHSRVTITFGKCGLGFGRAVRTTRALYADALNELSMMTPNLTKGGDQN